MESATSQPPLPLDKPKDKGKDGEAIKIKPLKDNIRDLCLLKIASDEAKEVLADKIKAVATQARLQASVVKRLVNARTSANFAKHAKVVEQLGIVFDEVGEA